MRTTLKLEDEAFEFAQAYANARAMKLGDAVSELIVKAREAVTGKTTKPSLGMKFVPIKGTDGLWVFDMPPGTPKLSAKEVRDLIERSEQDEDDRIIAMSQRPKRKTSKVAV